MRPMVFVGALVVHCAAFGTPPADATKPATTPPAGTDPAKPAGQKSAETKDAGGQLVLTGISFTVPSGWKAQDIAPGPMAPKAVYTIPARKPGEDEGSVRITHYPEMKGKDDMNIDRWIGQVTKADGQPATRAEAKIDKVETGNIRLTTVEVSGNVKMTMRDSAKPNHRMIAAIVDHPKGPHFVVAAGPADSMNAWSPEILNFLKSGKVNDK